DQCRLHIGDRMDDVQGAIVNRCHPNRSRQLRTDEWENSANTLRNFHRVRARAAIDGDNHSRRRYGIAADPEPHVDALVLNRVLDLGYIAQVYRSATAISHNQVAILIRTFELSLRAEHSGARIAV